MIFLLNSVGSVFMWKLIVWVLERLSLMWLFCGMCFLVMFSWVIIFRCEEMWLVSFIGGLVIVCSMLFMWKCMWYWVLNGLKWMFDVLWWMVFISILLMNFIIGVLLLLVVLMLVFLVFLLLLLVFSFRLFSLLLFMFEIVLFVVVSVVLIIFCSWLCLIRMGFIM